VLDDQDVYFPEAEIIQPLAMAFMRMMFAHAEFEEQVRRLQRAITNDPEFAQQWDTRKRPKRMAKLIKNHPGLIQEKEASEIVRVLTGAIAPCEQRNLLAHGRWWRFDPKTSTIKIRGERKGEPEWADYTEPKISTIGIELRTLAADLYKVRRDIEQRRGDHDVHESDRL
jgi:hypothetical protein